MRCFIPIVLAAGIGVARGAEVAGDQYIKIVESKRGVLSRPAGISELPLAKRNSLTSAELEEIRSRLKSDPRLDIEGLGKSFWSSPLLKAMAAFATDDSAEGIDIDDDWISKSVDFDPGSVFSSAEAQTLPPVRLVYLSQTGFSRIESSEEMMPASGRDLMASVPVADFCSRHPGRDIPQDFSVRFSPWDLGAQLASSSRLDSSLLELVLMPDAFDFRAFEEEGFYGDDAEDDDDPSSEENAWADVLEKNSRGFSDRSMSLAEFAAKTRRDKAIDRRVRSLLLASAVSVASLRKDCEMASGVWTELGWSKKHWLDIFSCRGVNGEAKGALLSVEDGDFGEGAMEFSWTRGALRLSAELESDQDGMVTRFYVGDQQVGTERWFSQDGTVKGARQLSRPDDSAVMYGGDGRVVWVRTIPGQKNLTDVAWYPNGAPRSFVQRSSSGMVEALAGFHPNGKAKYWLPIRSGKEDGKFVWWHESGAIAGELDFVAGKKFGKGRLFYENGIEGYQGDYSEDSLHGRIVWRDPTRRPLFNLSFTGGRPHGLLEIRHGGRALAEARFEAGAVEGSIIMRNARGIGVAEIPYKSGLLDGVVLFRDAGGMLRVKSQWMDGQAHGETEAIYASGVRAATCRFDQGHLVDWMSFSPESGIRYKGKVTSLAEGKAVVDYYGGTESPVARCQSQEWVIEQCASVAGATPLQMPGIKDMLGKITDSEGLSFKPEKCGGSTRSMDVSSIVDHKTGSVDVTYRVKELCQTKSLATGMRCQIAFAPGGWLPGSCVLSDDDLDEHED